MNQMDDESYFAGRERHCREMAQLATHANVRTIHLELARLYARRCGAERLVRG